MLVLAATGCQRHAPTPSGGQAEVVPRAGPVFNEAFTDGFEARVGDQIYRFRSQVVGELSLPSGRLLACDPLVSCSEPFTGRVPVGRFPLHLAIARNGEDERIALAKIVFAEGPIVSWELALTAGQDVSTLKPGEFFGYGVDSGTGGFMDADALALFEAERARGGQAFDQQLFDALDRTYRHTRSWHLYQTSGGTVAMFSSGYGDGAYPTYRAYDKAGRLVAVITDFMIVPWR
ncbi:DUF4241 domain-containing protein [Uliginosibacterium sp. H1]|uniref:DUF4241 domain-containing protein n=1 Tax=Uliginosibacterium sp. H1 TaxID=3114757 RepID=UPI002E17DAAD|nr:DUF4241 domain-containing protein [Uliginosibacterium sp. H1]